MGTDFVKITFDEYENMFSGIATISYLNSIGHFPKKQNPYVPEAIYVNEEKRTMVVKWIDGTENKVTADEKDEFSVESGFAIALMQKIFGGKKEFKNKWWPIISRRFKFSESQKKDVFVYGTTDTIVENIRKLTKKSGF